MKIMVDTNIVLDVLLLRDPFFEESQIILESIESNKISGFLCATTITTIQYLCQKKLDRKTSLLAIRQLLKFFKITPVNRIVIEQVIASDFSDFEDAILYFSAMNSNLDAIVTRDRKGFNSLVNFPIYFPKELIDTLKLYP